MNSGGYKKLPKRPTPKRPDYRDYETLKRAWCREHPHASPLEYQKAMRQIALMLGV